MAKYFGTNGIRAKLDFLTPEFASRMAAAFGTWIQQGTDGAGAKGPGATQMQRSAAVRGAGAEGAGGCKILVGRDTRTSGEMLESAVAAGLTSAGCSVVKLGICPSPTVEFSVLKHKANGAVIVTASHNPPEWNALKFVDEKSIDISRERGEEVERIFDSNSAKRAEWDALKPMSTYDNAPQDHADAVKARINTTLFKRAKPKLVLDLANGTMARIAPQFFKSLGCSVTTLNGQMDGHFPGRPSEPTEANIADLIASVKELKADMGIAWDGDGDRVVFVDEKGKFVIGDRILALCEKMVLAKRKGPVVTTVSTTNAIRDIADAAGCKTIYCRIGAPYIAEEMYRLKAVVGGEEVGGVVWPEIGYGKDGLMTAAKIVEAACTTPLSKLVAALPQYSNSKIKVPCPPERTQAAMRTVVQLAQQKAKGAKLTTIDGVRTDFADSSWVIMRPSGTENYIRIFSEAKEAEKARRLMDEYAKIVKDAVG